MSSTDSKFAKSLQIHTLENLVFEKRQRKTLTQQPTNTLNPVNRTKTKIKKTKKSSQVKEVFKIKKPKSKKSIKSLQTPKKHKIIKKREYLSSKNLVQSKNLKSLSKAKSKQIPSKKVNTEYKTNKSNQNQKQKQNLNKQTKKNAQNQDLRNTKPQKIIQSINQCRIQNEKLSVSVLDQKQLKIESIPKKLGRPRKPVQVVKQNLHQNNHENQQNINKDNQRRSPVKIRALANILDSGSKNQFIQIQQVPKHRQAKLNALKKYTQKQLYPEDSFEFQRDFSNKRKKIHKVNKTDHYSINRIFRKQPKLDLNPINIEVKLEKLNLNAFKQKFGTFDVIHCSLPLSMIWQLPSISNLMVKGFIFIWVEKGETALAYHLMKRMGYDVIDQIVWVKCDESTRKIFNESLGEDETNLTQNNLFLNSKSVCFVGYKCPTGQKAQYRTKISNNLIFSCPKFNQPLRKPDQIYEIADLLMPGSKKLQFGGKQQKGWLSLHHNEFRLRKCLTCLCQLQQNKGRVFKDEETNKLSSICQKCYQFLSEQKEEISAQNDSQEQQNQIHNLNQNIIVKSIQYLDQQIQNQCLQCQKTNCQQAILCSCNLDTQNLYCKQCYTQAFSSHLTHSLHAIKVKKDTFIPSSHLSCSECKKNTLFSHFYQCIASGCRTKSHLLCQQCFWKCGYEMIHSESDANELKRKRNDGLHEFRLKKIFCLPEQKSVCSCSCRGELQLPHLVCESCVGWRWCGKCDNNDEVHQVNQQRNESCDGKHMVSLIY